MQIGVVEARVTCWGFEVQMKRDLPTYACPYSNTPERFTVRFGMVMLQINIYFVSDHSNARKGTSLKCKTYP